jgi:hypothetical protein
MKFDLILRPSKGVVSTTVGDDISALTHVIFKKIQKEQTGISAGQACRGYKIKTRAERIPTDWIRRR